jgi:rubrerythrin
MPVFGSPFSGLTNDRKLADEELIRAIRFMVAAEYEAVQLYMQLAESTDNKLAVEVLKDIADEERVHAGEFLRLLRELAPDEEKFYAEGAKEVEGEIGKMKQRTPWQLLSSETAQPRLELNSSRKLLTK